MYKINSALSSIQWLIYHKNQTKLVSARRSDLVLINKKKSAILGILQLQRTIEW